MKRADGINGMKHIVRGMKVLSVVVTVALFGLFWIHFYTVPYISDRNSHTLICLFYAALVVFLNRTYNAFDVGMLRVSELIYSLCLADFITACIMYGIACILCHDFAAPVPVVIMVALQCAWNTLWAVATNALYFRINKPRSTAVVFREKEQLKKLERIKFFSLRFDVKTYVQNPAGMDALCEQLQDCCAVFIIGIEANLRNEIVRYCVETGKQGYVIPHVGDIIMSGASHMQMFSVPIVRVRQAVLTPEFRFAKRTIDIAASLVGLIVLSPIMLLTMLAIKLCDGGPVFYRQVRLTQYGREFEILKFRSMCQDAEKDGIARLAGEHDQRITPVGKVIRACRVDELPQLINILRGDMTIVGPRPERPEIAAQYEKEMPEFRLRLQVKAGLTGLAQIYGCYNTEPQDKLLMDLMYINQMSIAEDFRLILATVKVLFMKESTAGVSVQESCSFVDACEKQDKSA